MEATRAYYFFLFFDMNADTAGQTFSLTGRCFSKIAHISAHAELLFKDLPMRPYCVTFLEKIEYQRFSAQKRQ